MSNEPEKPGGEAQPDNPDEAGDEQERPTVAPPFDPEAFAREVLSKPSPAQGTPAVAAPARTTPLGVPRPPSPTLTDPAELEEARLQSIGSRPPRKTTPGGALSLANVRVPTNVPPRATDAPQRTESFSGLQPVDREWAEIATRPPPPMQQELIDALALGDGPPSTKQAPERSAEAAAEAERAAQPPSSSEAPVTEQEMNDRVSLGDYTGALAIAEKLLEADPDHEAAKACAESCRSVLRQMYAARIGALDRVPLVMVPRDQLRWLSIDHRAGFVLSLIDGVSSLEMILDVSGMPELDALRILSELVQQRIISFR